MHLSYNGFMHSVMFEHCHVIFILCSVTISKGCVIEFSRIEKGVNIQENCILSNLHIPVRLLKLQYTVLITFMYLYHTG